MFRQKGKNGQAGIFQSTAGTDGNLGEGLGNTHYLAWLGILTHSSFIWGGKLRWIVIHVQDTNTEGGSRHL